jgi:hypothetical protein
MYGHHARTALDDFWRYAVKSLQADDRLVRRFARNRDAKPAFGITRLVDQGSQRSAQCSAIQADRHPDQSCGLFKPVEMFVQQQRMIAPEGTPDGVYTLRLPGGCIG